MSREQTHPSKLGTFLPTGMMRWLNGRLQQQGEVFSYWPGKRRTHGFEWRDVPVEPSPRHSTGEAV